MSTQFEHTSEAGWLAVVKAQVESVRFGTVQVVIHESRVVQIDKTEKVRVEKADRANSESRVVRLVAHQ